MPYQELWFLVEGADDARFGQHVLYPVYGRSYETIRLWQYASRSPKKTRQLLRSIAAIGAEYICLGDFDEGPCVSAVRCRAEVRTGGAELENIVVVIREIEAWYLAGLNDEACDRIGYLVAATPMMSTRNSSSELCRATSFPESISCKRFSSRSTSTQRGPRTLHSTTC